MPLDEPTQSGPPAAYFPEPGTSIIVGIIDVNRYQQRDFDTGDLKFWDDGKPKEGRVVTGLVITVTGAAKGTAKNNEPVNPGDLVTFWCEGGKHYTYEAAKKTHGPVERGDVMMWKREADEPAKNSRHADRKVYTARIRRPEAKDGDIIARCEQAHRQTNPPAVLDTTPVPVPAAAWSDDDLSF